MSKKPKLKAASSGQETLGQRLSRIQKERGFTQQQLPDRTGLIQVLISDYEHGKLRLSAETSVRFADVLGITTDELLRGKKSTATTRRQPSFKLLPADGTDREPASVPAAGFTGHD